MLVLYPNENEAVIDECIPSETRFPERTGFKKNDDYRNCPMRRVVFAQSSQNMILTQTVENFLSIYLNIHIILNVMFS